MDELISQLNRAIAAAREEFIYANVVMIDDNIYKTLFPIYKFGSVGEDADGAYVHMELEKACPVICGLKAFASDLKPFLKDTAFALFETKEEENEEPRWISVKDRLPEKQADVLLFFGGKYGNMATGFWHGEEKEDCVWWCAYTDDGFYTDCDYKPTHWMPLPQPPKGE